MPQPVVEADGNLGTESNAHGQQRAGSYASGG